VRIEIRKHRRYLYYSRRINGKPKNFYFGPSHELLEAQHRLNSLEHARIRFEAFCQRADAEEIHEETRAYRAWFRAAESLIASVMGKAGFHRVRRQWRRRRGAEMDPIILTSPTARIDRAGWVTEELAKRAGILDEKTRADANKGNLASIKVVDEYFAENPAAQVLWGDLGLQVLQKWVEIYSSGNLKCATAMVRHASRLRADLAGPHPNALDVLLAERVTLAWIFASWSDLQLAGNAIHLADNYRVQEQLIRRCDMAQRSLMTACRTLAKVRRAKLPEILAMINVSPSA